MRLPKLLERALNESLKSNHHAHALGAVIFRKGKVLSKGHNRVRRGVSRVHGYWEGSVHAEIGAIINARCSVVGADMLVARNNSLIARPCWACLAALKAEGIRRVFYTNNGIIEMEKLK